MDDAMGYGHLLGHSVVSGTGGFEGKVRDFIFGFKTGRIERIKFDYSGSTLLPEPLVTVKSVEIQDVLSLEGERVYIKDSSYAVTERIGTLDGPIRFLVNAVDDPEGILDYETRYRLWEQEWGKQYREFYGRDPVRPHYLPPPVPLPVDEPYESSPSFHRALPEPQEAAPVHSREGGSNESLTAFVDAVLLAEEGKGEKTEGGMEKRLEKKYTGHPKSSSLQGSFGMGTNGGRRPRISTSATHGDQESEPSSNNNPTKASVEEP
uniref:PRC-barrel domain-containing protein n=2 Tax=Amorphochlora amoebiformis TaxID=1561963 RepID=A0A7S0D2J9_9EUKA